jgi:hypothetical protein
MGSATAPVRIAMWSGPRNISTAMMRSWEARGDCAVVDEPFYAHYLEATGLPHPGAADVIAQHETDPRRVIGFLTGRVPDGRPVFYQKHMCHHMLPDVPLDWLTGMRHCMLLREPRRMLISLAKVTPNPTLEDTGLPQQERLHDEIAQRTGAPPPLFDSADILADPANALRLMCESLAVEYTDRMLTWPPGRRATDGAWAAHWYANVERSTGFEKPREVSEEAPARLSGLLRECGRIYERLAERRVNAPGD